MPDSFMHWNRTRLMPNGDLIVQFETYGDTPWGYGIARLDKDSNVVWRYLGRSRSEEHTSELQSLMRISYAVFCLKKKKSIYNTSNVQPSTISNTTPEYSRANHQHTPQYDIYTHSKAELTT